MEFSGGLVFITFGGVSSFGPPSRDPIFAQETVEIAIKANSKFFRYLSNIELLMLSQTYKLNPKFSKYYTTGTFIIKSLSELI